MTEQHPATARLGTLADDDLDRVGAPQVVGVHSVARRQQLVDELVGVATLLRGHAAVPGRGRSADLRGAPAERLLGGTRQRSEAHPGDRDRDVEADRFRREPGADHDVGRATLAVALQRVARHAGAEEQQIVEVRQLAFGAEAADVVDPLARCALDVGDRVAIERRRLAQPRTPAGARRVVNDGHVSTPRRCRC